MTNHTDDLVRRGKALRDLNVIFIGPCRDAAGEKRSEATARQWCPEPMTCWNTGASEIASSRCHLGVMVATEMPADTDVVVMLDDDVRPSPVDLIGLIGWAAYDLHSPVVFMSYALRLPPGSEGQDARIAHYVSSEWGGVVGGLGCVAMTARCFRFLHLNAENEAPLVKTHPSLPPSTAPYRVGVYDGRWLSEDIYFCRNLLRRGVPSALYPKCAMHGKEKVTRRFSMLDGSPLVSSLIVDQG